MIKLIHADDFFHEKDVHTLSCIIPSLTFQQKDYGLEVDQFNLFPPDSNEIFSNALNTPVEIVEDLSGIFRKSMQCIHFESFEQSDEWCFIIAIETTTFNLYHHLTGAKTALDGYNFNYQNLFEWDYDVNIILKPNQGVFFRPWLFHSIQDGLVQYYRIKPIKKE